MNKPDHFEGELRTEKLESWAGLWLRADGDEEMLFFDLMHDRAVRGTSDWSRFNIDAQVPQGTAWINDGIVS